MYYLRNEIIFSICFSSLVQYICVALTVEDKSAIVSSVQDSENIVSKIRINIFIGNSIKMKLLLENKSTI